MRPIKNALLLKNIKYRLPHAQTSQSSEHAYNTIYIRRVRLSLQQFAERDCTPYNGPMSNINGFCIFGGPGGAGNAITIELSHLFVLAAQDYSSSIVEIAEECIIKDGPALWRDRERHLLNMQNS
ncbi:hypothetical protein V1525DRAFT_21115 [Lipomyces kononenkoae]|uniref:Uncharacterized protein n=1 Tax=Lipomyces kononenkoae TaxID=34357 RepID=A0ACC3SUF7_LIPKO